MNGESKRSFALALASFAIGAVVAGVLGNQATRQRIARAGKKLAKRARTADLA
jgi:hypothetical protein